jgi:acetolactate synthase-1/2/3 large subunit
MKFSDTFVGWLVEEGYTHCFFVAGGNIMHLLNSVRRKMVCVPFVNEVGAAIAAEYFTEAARRSGSSEKAFALVTAGPGLTNTVTAFASAWTESRELLVVGGQVKSSDLSKGEVRQRGIQEIDGIAIVQSLCKGTLLIDQPVAKRDVLQVIRSGSDGRKGPVFIEFCLDAQASFDRALESIESDELVVEGDSEGGIGDINSVSKLLESSERPSILLGGGLDRKTVRSLTSELEALGIPIFLTWNGADLLPSMTRNLFGRPNTWGQRSANLLIQQSDLVIAIGTRLGIQQTGFAWDEFVPNGKIIQVDIDGSELSKGHPKVNVGIKRDGNKFLSQLVEIDQLGSRWPSWLEFCNHVAELVPVLDSANVTGPGYTDPFEILHEIAAVASPDDFLIPCSSGGSFTVAMQSLMPRGNQRIITNKGMASMGYGLSGAIGTALQDLNVNTFLFEGDGGFAQNLQELGTVAATKANLKMFIFDNGGYASIRMTQRNYFDGAWVGCDVNTGLGLPNLELLAATYGIPFAEMDPSLNLADPSVLELIAASGPALIRVLVDPEQTYFPKIASRVLADGSMKSNPLHKMEPPLDISIEGQVLKYV